MHTDIEVWQIPGESSYLLLVSLHTKQFVTRKYVWFGFFGGGSVNSVTQNFLSPVLRYNFLIYYLVILMVSMQVECISLDLSNKHLEYDIALLTL